MGKIRIKTLGDEEKEKKQKEEERKRREAKIAESKAEAKKVEAEESPVIANEVKQSQTQEVATDKEKSKKQKTSVSHVQKHSSKYTEIAALVDKNKAYKLQEALTVLPKLKRAKFDETVELHINTIDKGISGNVTLPHGTGKQVRVAIASDEVIAKVEKGVIDFDVLIAEPSMMPKLAKVARFLGPRGLMPNPKNGTISPTPSEVAKKYQGGAINYKTESKFPILHLSVGKVSFGEDKLAENIKTIIGAVQTKNIKTATLKSTMSPGIKLDINSL
jgi:large subunit ribosomal protein L1